MTTINQTERLDRAIAHVGATELTCGGYAYYDNAMRRYYVVSSVDLADLCCYLDDSDPQISRDAYSHWCAGTEAKKMPEGWCPND
jgi:hypothetical protein